MRKTKQKLGWPTEPEFLIPDEALAHFRKAVARGAHDEAAWNERMSAYAKAFPDLCEELQRRLRDELPPAGMRTSRYFRPMPRASPRARHPAR